MATATSAMHERSVPGERSAAARLPSLQRPSKTDQLIGPTPRDAATVIDASPPRLPAPTHTPTTDAGRPLPAGIRDQMEQRLGANLGEVSLHTDREAARQATLQAARAYTVGRHVYFGPGFLVPDRPTGRELLAHELAHLVLAGSAARSSSAAGGLTTSSVASPDERDAVALAGGGSPSRAPDQPLTIRREACRAMTSSLGWKSSTRS